MTARYSFFTNLSELECFDPSVFRGDGNAPQEVCNLILALACFFNDWKDMQIATNTLFRIKPAGPPRETPAWGEFNGLLWHLIRLQVSLVHEVLSLIARSESAVKHPYFQKIIKGLPPPRRQIWDALAHPSSDTGATEFSKFCLFIRNKIAFHYDPKALFQGYSNWYLHRGPKKKPYISRGEALVNERFYFAEASAESYFESLYGTKALDPEKLMSLCDLAGLALSQVVKDFIELRSREIAIPRRT